MQKRWLLVFIALFYFMPVAFATHNPAPNCHAAEFAETGTQDYFRLECGNVNPATGQQPDGLCPEDYGDWSHCALNIVTNGKCDQPDIDCPGQVIPDLMFVEFPNTIQPSTAVNPVAFNLKVQVNKCALLGNPPSNSVVLVRNYGTLENPTYRVVGTQSFTSTPVTLTFSDAANPDLQSPQGGGVSYRFLAYCADKMNYAVTANGITTPEVTIITPQPGTCNAIQGNPYLIDAQAISAINIRELTYGAEVEISPGRFDAVDPATCLTCPNAGCSVFDRVTPASAQSPLRYSGKFDSTKCLNLNVRFNVTAYDGQNNFAVKSVVCTIANATPGCPGCDFASQFLNLVVARVKIWT